MFNKFIENTYVKIESMQNIYDKNRSYIDKEVKEHLLYIKHDVVIKICAGIFNLTDFKKK